MKWGERPFAIIALAPDDDGNIGEEGIRVRVASYVEMGVIPGLAILEKVAFAVELPLTSVGNVDKKKMRLLFQ